MIVRTDAVVLRAFDYGETSRIALLLTRAHGVLSVLAKGARRPRSQFGSTLQPLAHVQVVYYHKPGRGLQTLKEAAHVTRFASLQRDLGRLPLALRALEIARAMLDEGEAHPLAVELLVATLSVLDLATERAANALPWFGLHLAGLLGFSPDVQRADVLALGDDGGGLLLDTGAVVPAGGIRASRAALRAFAIFARTDLETSMRLALDDATRREVDNLVDAYLRTHAGSALPERVRAVAHQLDAGLDAARAAQEPEAGGPVGESP